MFSKILLTCFLIFSDSTILSNSFDEVVEVKYSVERSNDKYIGGFQFLGGTNYKKVIDEKWGYVYYDLNIYKTNFTNKSNLFLVHILTDFTPGYQAVANNESGYTDHFLDNGYVHLKALSFYEDNDDSRYGSRLNLKAFWPKSSDFTTTITSSYGTSIVVNNEISVGADLSKGVTLGTKNNNSLSLSFNKTVAVTYKEPYISSQVSASNAPEVQWQYQISDNKNVHKVAGSVTYSLETFYLFEMDNYSYSNCGQNAFCLDYSVYMQNLDYGFLNIKLKKESSYSIRLNCFID